MSYYNLGCGHMSDTISMCSTCYQMYNRPIIFGIGGTTPVHHNITSPIVTNEEKEIELRKFCLEQAVNCLPSLIGIITTENSDIKEIIDECELHISFMARSYYDIIKNDSYWKD